MATLIQYWHSLRHTRPRQLGARLELMSRRGGHRALARCLARSGATRTCGLALAPCPPEPLFAPRSHLVERRDDRLDLCLLRERREITTPMDWQPPVLEADDRLWRLTLHGMEFLEALDDERFSRLIEDWILRNPPYRPGYWRHNWNSFALSIRCVVWMQQWALRPSIRTGDVASRLTTSLVAQLRFLTRNLELDLGGNHLIKNIKALLWAGRFFQGREAECWARRGAALLERQLPEQILGDGMHFERSPAYHAQVFADLLDCYAVLPPGALRDALEARLAPMAQVLADTTHPDGLPSLFNDGGLHMTFSPRECLSVYTRLTGRVVSPRSLFALPEAGYYGIRGDGSFALVDCGPIGPDTLPAHGHGDILSFEWTLRGLRIIVDAGVCEYRPGPWRAYSRATVAHNTVAIDERDQCEFWQSFRVGRRARVGVEQYAAHPDQFTLAGSHDGYRHLAGAPRHSRRLTVAAERLQVVDTVHGGAGQSVQARLLLHPQCRIEQRRDAVRIQRDGVTAELRAAGEIQVVDAWWCPDFGVRVAAPQIILHYGRAPCRGEFVLSATPA